VIEMIKGKYAEFKKTDLISPFFVKSKNTLQLLLGEMGMDPSYQKLIAKYKEVKDPLTVI